MIDLESFWQNAIRIEEDKELLQEIIDDDDWEAVYAETLQNIV